MAKFRYIEISSIRGMDFKHAEEGACVYVDMRNGVSAHLLRNADEYLKYLDTHRALASMVMKGIADSEKFGENFSTQLELARKIREDIKIQAGNCFLIIMKEGTTELDVSRIRQLMENLAFGFELGDKETIRSE